MRRRLSSKLKSMSRALTGLDSILIRFKSGTVVSVLLMREDGSMSELRSREMWHWLEEFGLHLKVFPTKLSSRQTSLGFERPPEAE